VVFFANKEGALSGSQPILALCEKLAHMAGTAGHVIVDDGSTGETALASGNHQDSQLTRIKLQQLGSSTLESVGQCYDEAFIRGQRTEAIRKVQ